MMNLRTSTLFLMRIALLANASLIAASHANAEYVRGEVRNSLDHLENSPPTVFPNKEIPPKWPDAKPQTHGLDLTQYDEATSRAYFKWLCDNEAGEFIFKTVDAVDSIFQMRRRVGFDYDFRHRDRYYFEDPWGAIPWNTGLDEFGDLFVTGYLMGSDVKFVKGWMDRGDYYQYFPGYKALEKVASPLEKQRYGEGTFVRYTRVWPSHPEYDRGPEGKVRMFQKREFLNGPPKARTPTELDESRRARSSGKREDYEAGLKAIGTIPPAATVTEKIESRYGWTWRGIERSAHDRQLGIGGGESLVFDLKTNEVLAFRRNFRRTNPGTGNVSWATGQQCMKFENKGLLLKVLIHPDPFVGISVPKSSVQPTR